jgi:hypothetical protein
MDEYLFQEALNGSMNIVEETTTYFEAFVFEDPARDFVKKESVVAMDKLEALLGSDDSPEDCVGGIRLM